MGDNGGVGLVMQEVLEDLDAALPAMCGERSSVRLILNTDTVGYETTLRSHRLKLLPLPLREAPLVADVDLYT